MHSLSDPGRALHSDGQVARPRQQSLGIRRGQTRGNSFTVPGAETYVFWSLGQKIVRKKVEIKK